MEQGVVQTPLQTNRIDQTLRDSRKPLEEKEAALKLQLDTGKVRQDES